MTDYEYTPPAEVIAARQSLRRLYVALSLALLIAAAWMWLQ